jgi:hypothetical protein
MKRILLAGLLAALLLSTGLPARAAVPADQMRFATNWQQYRTLQTDLFELTAGAGDLHVWVEVQGAPRRMGIGLYDVANDQWLVDEDLVVDQVASYTVPVTGGTYQLLLAANTADWVGVEGSQVDLTTIVPALELPNLARFSTQNRAFDQDVALFNAPQTEQLALYLDDTLIAENLLGPDGQPVPAAVDTTGLADGIHRVAAVGKTRGANNFGVAAVPILVDREDTFQDVPARHWARPYVETMFHLGIVNGRGDGRYAPADPVTRAEFAKLLAGTLGLEAAPGTPDPFADTAGHWAEPYILALWEAGLVQGDVVNGQRYFYPQRTLTRAEAAAIIARALGLDQTPVTGEPFSDWAQVPEWARSSVFALAQAGWINGFPDGTYGPGIPLQRDQSAKLMGMFFGMQ